MTTFPTAAVIDLCRQYGPQVHVPAPLDGARLMLAIAAVESGGANPLAAGHNCGPRHEASYDTNGGFWRQSPTQQDLVREHGTAAACSYGPWQMMFCNFSPDLTPDECNTDLARVAVEFVRHFNLHMRRWNPQNLDEIGEIWNTGKIGPDSDYVTKLQRAYMATDAVLAPAEKEG